MNLEENEIAKHIEGYEGLYLITNMGRIFGINRKMFLTPVIFKNYKNPSKDGYYCVKLCKNCKRNTFSIHRLIAIHFIENPNPTEYDMVDHKNGITTDNRIENLRWCNRQLNTRNSKKKQNTSSKYKGVCFYKQTKKWQSNIRIEKKLLVHLGYFDTEEEAAIAYNQYIIDNNLKEFFILNDI